MSRISDSLQQIDPSAALPVILPIAQTSAEEGSRQSENGLGLLAADYCDHCDTSGSIAGKVRHSVPGRFAFPALSDTQVDVLPPRGTTAIWPECDDSDTARACARAAEKMIRQWKSDRSTVVVVTSPCDGDGKTSLVVALAPALAQRASKGVLVVDANVAKADLTGRLMLPAGEPASRSALIYPTNLDRLSVLPAWPMYRQNLSGFDRAWIEELREGWPLVILDAASLGHVDAVGLARRCDGAYLVVRRGFTPRRAVAEAARLLRRTGARLLGNVVIG